MRTEGETRTEKKFIMRKRKMGRAGRQCLVVLLVFLLAMPVFPSMAEETVSGGDAAETLPERQVDTAVNSVSDGDASGNIASGVDGNISWVIDANGKLTISGTGDFSYPYADKPWASYCEKVFSAEITVSGMTNASGLFYGCTNLQSINLSGFDTSSVTIMVRMFGLCSNLSSLDISNFDTGNVKYIGGMFNGCSNLSSLDLSGFDTSNVTNMSYLFSGCSSLNSLDLSGFDTSSVREMEGMFQGCSSLNSLDLSSFDTSNVINMSYLFSGCSSLNSLDLSGFDMSSVEYVGDIFSGCSNLSTIYSPYNVTVQSELPVLSGIVWRTPDRIDVTEFPQNLSYSVKLTRHDTEDIPDGTYIASGVDGNISWVIDTNGKLTISGTGDFSDPYSDKPWASYSEEILSAEIIVSGMTNAHGLFSGCTNVQNIDVSGFDTSNVTNMFGMFSNCSSLSSVDVSGFDTSNVTNMGTMFYNCRSLSSVDVSSFDTGDVTDMELMFSDCRSLSNLDVSGFDTSNVTRICGMFSGCSNLNSLDVSGFNTSNVTDMGCMFFRIKEDGSGYGLRKGGIFSDCSSLSSLDVSGFDTSNVTNMSYLFSGCGKLSSLDVSSFDTSNVTDMREMFFDCSSLNSINVSSFDTSNVTSMEDIFFGCNNLSTIYSPYNVAVSAELPVLYGTTWRTSDGTDVTELPQNLNYSIKLTRHYTKGIPEITTTTPDLNMDNVIRVKYVPYSYTVQTNNEYDWNTVTFSVVEGRLAEGLQMYPATGEIYGVPLETGEFPITVRADYSNPDFFPSYAQLTLIVKDNTDVNISTATDPGYDIIQPVQNISLNALPGGNSQVLVSKGEYAEFLDLYLDGEKLTKGTDYISEAGSTRITILNQTLTRKGTGTHTLGIEFRTQGTNELKRAAQNFVVAETPNPGGNGGGNNEGNGGGGNNSGNTVSDRNNAADADPQILETEETTTVIYIVMPGDNLWKIAARFYGNGNYWRKIYADNVDLIRNPGRIYAGQKLTIYLTKDKTSAESGVDENTYRVAVGDNLWKIARRVYGDGKLWRRIYEANRMVITNPGKIHDGLVLRIPRM